VRCHQRHALDGSPPVIDAIRTTFVHLTRPPRMRKPFALSLLFAMSGCGSTEPENILYLSGTVVAASAGSGYTAGQGIDGAQVTLRYQPPLEPTSEIFDTDVSNASGAWSVRTGPPRGQSAPNCTTLSVAAVSAGFSSSTVNLSSFCGVGPGDISGIEIALTPN